MLHYAFFLISEKTCHSHSHDYLCRATASMSVDFQNVLHYNIRRKKKRDCLRHSHDYLCRATASISVDFQNVLQYSIRRKKRETAYALSWIFVSCYREYKRRFSKCAAIQHTQKKKRVLTHSLFFLGAPIRIRTRTNGSEDHCAIHYTIRAFTFCLIYLYFSRFCKFVNFISAKNFQFAFILFDKFNFDS